MLIKRWKEYAIYLWGHLLSDTIENDKKYLSVLYHFMMNMKCDFDYPIKFSEKIQWLKLYDRNPSYSNLVDKYMVRNYVKIKIGEAYLVQCLGIWNRFDEIDFNKLPEKFVLKCTHDSGGLVICKDKKQFNLKAAKKRIEHCLNRNYYYNHREWVYKNIKPQIIAERYLENSKNEGLYDYKVWCFNGRAEYIQFISGRNDKQTYEVFFDREWKKQFFTYHNPLLTKYDIPKPDNLNELIKISEILSIGIPFLRCDFYILNDGHIKFGELTFYPMSGLEKWHPNKMDFILGEMCNLSIIKN